MQLLSSLAESKTILSLSSTSSRPDIVLISSDHIILMELSVVTNTEQHFVAASSRKEAHYGPLLLDLEHTGLSVTLVTIEVGCLGHFLPSNLCKVCYLQKRPFRNVLSELFSNKLLELLSHASTEFSMLTHQDCGMLRNFCFLVNNYCMYIVMYGSFCVVFFFLSCQGSSYLCFS